MLVISHRGLAHNGGVGGLGFALSERATDRAEHLQGLSPRLRHKSPRFIRSAMCSAARAASAMIVCVGFFSDADGNTLPSTT